MTNSGALSPIVVAVDGSAPAQAALDWASTEAATRNLPLRLVHAFIWPMMRPRVDLGPVAGIPDSGLQAAAERVLSEARDRVHSLAPDVDVNVKLDAGTPGAILLAESHDAELIVLGNRGLGGFTGLLVGSVGVQVAAHATCPVVVVRPTSPTPDAQARTRVVVGVDGSPASEIVLDFAFEAAARRNLGLTVVHASTGSAVPYSGLAGDLPSDLPTGGALELQEHELLAETLATRFAKYPTVDASTRMVWGRPGPTLVAESAGATMLVVGSHGHSGFRGLLLGSVSQYALHHADCTVAIVRPMSSRVS